ncbi:LysR substrate-binding domain-containing protein [Bradyrhizobium sp. LVM 105]|uniref:LysR substrate-binding domain-containing protein n=1 Tax=Bradyrhizobium sp. LVM 105 TaxID=2341115 RepID=UPI000F805DAC|nr:LysR substrate-binding domain-containing protein [Bradyrhizobium sp. LVM 105]RTE87895.1 LysR family transcriptional regulator [Bradyrhizobium sp. LVM 105]
MSSSFMQLRHLRYFTSIVDAGSFCQAAVTIHVAQPALSQQMAALEAELGVVLLHRSVRGVRPTREGLVFYREAKSILQKVDELRSVIRSTAGKPEVAVRLGMSSALAAPFACALMEASRTALPEVRLHLVTGDSLQMKPLIASGALDICAVLEDEPTSGVTRQPLFQQRLHLVRPPDTGEVAPAVSLEEMAELPLVLPTRPNTIRNALDRTFEVAGVMPNCVAEVDTFASALSFVRAGLANAILPKGDIPDIPGHEALRPVVIDPPIHMTACLISSGDLASAAEAVSALLIAQVGKVLRAGCELIAMPDLDSKGKAQTVAERQFGGRRFTY